MYARKADAGLIEQFYVVLASHPPGFVESLEDNHGKVHEHEADYLESPCMEEKS